MVNIRFVIDCLGEEAKQQSNIFHGSTSQGVDTDTYRPESTTEHSLENLDRAYFYSGLLVIIQSGVTICTFDC